MPQTCRRREGTERCEAKGDEEAMTAGRITKWRVTSHRLRFGSGLLDEKWFYTSESAETEVKARLGLERLNDSARETRWEVVDAPKCNHDGHEWTGVFRREYSQEVLSSGKQETAGFVRIDTMERPSPPLVNPFAQRPSVGGVNKNENGE